jgi:hypothetical protein
MTARICAACRQHRLCVRAAFLNLAALPGATAAIAATT